MAKDVSEWITVNGKHIPVYSGESKEDAYNRSVAKDNEDKKQQQIAKNREQTNTLNGKTTMQKNAKALGLDYEKEGTKLIKEFKAKTESLSQLQYEYSKTGNENTWNKIQETKKWIKDHNKAVHEYKQTLGDKTSLW